MSEEWELMWWKLKTDEWGKNIEARILSLSLSQLPNFSSTFVDCKPPPKPDAVVFRLGASCEDLHPQPNPTSFAQLNSLSLKHSSLN